MDNIAEALFQNAFEGAARDQATTMLATTLGVFRDGLIKAGFQRPEAVILCNTWLSSMVLAMGKVKKDG